MRYASPAMWLTLIVATVTQSALADLQVYPTRLIMSETKRVANLSLRHLGDKPGTYRVTAVFYRMKNNGSFEEVVDPKAEERPLLKYLRFSPREVTLAPNTEQVVRVMFAGPGNLPEGEYRAHLHLLPTSTVDEPSDPTAKKDNKIKMEIQMRIAFAVPVIFRKGNPSYTVKLERMRVLKSEETGPQAAVDIEYSGAAYPFGDFYAFLTKGSKEEQIGIAKGVGAYVSPRTAVIPLSIAKEAVAGGKLRIEFRKPEDQGGEVIQKAEAALP